MRPEKLYLLDIVAAADSIQRFIESVDEALFMQDELRQSAVLQKITVIGEAAARLPVEFVANHPEIDWHAIIGFRNIAVHEYFALMWDIVWNTAVDDIPMLRSLVIQIVQNELDEDK